MKPYIVMSFNIWLINQSIHQYDVKPWFGQQKLFKQLFFLAKERNLNIRYLKVKYEEQFLIADEEWFELGEGDPEFSTFTSATQWQEASSCESWDTDWSISPPFVVASDIVTKASEGQKKVAAMVLARSLVLKMCNILQSRCKEVAVLILVP